ncbi:MAG: hypothetical protein NTY45_10120 [Elusimicrobia bacterium]|nr:hypothetical protein [Elusimicrobiota bacterium]
MKSRTANELVVSWLKTFFDKESFEDLVFPVFSENSGLQALSPTQQALKRTLVQTTMFVSPKQLSVISENKDIYACFLLASAETGILTPKIIADASGMSVASAEKAMKRLAAVKALKAVKPGQYKCPFAGKMVEFPQLMTVPDIRKNLENIQDELIASGKPMYSRRGIIRADTLAIADFFPVLSLNTAAAQAYAITNKTENSAIFAVDCRVTKILDF